MYLNYIWYRCIRNIYNMQQETDTNVSTVTMQSSIVRVVGFESSENLSGIVHLYETLTWRSGFGKLHGGNHFRFFLSCRIDWCSRILFILQVDLLGSFFTTDPWIQKMDLHNTDPTQLPHFFESSHRFFRLESTKRWHRTLGILPELLWVFSSLAFTFDSFPGVDRGRTSPKAQAESTTQTTGLAGRGPGELAGLMGSRRGNDWNTVQLMMMDLIMLMEASPVMLVEFSLQILQDVWALLVAFVVTNFGREGISVGKLSRRLQVHTLAIGSIDSCPIVKFNPDVACQLSLLWLGQIVFSWYPYEFNWILVLLSCLRIGCAALQRRETFQISIFKSQLHWVSHADTNFSRSFKRFVM